MSNPIPKDVVDVIATEILVNTEFFSSATIANTLMVLNEFLPYNCRARLRIEDAEPKSAQLVINAPGPYGRDSNNLGEELFTTHIIRQNIDTAFSKITSGLTEGEAAVITMSPQTEPDLQVVMSVWKDVGTSTYAVWTGQQQQSASVKKCLMH